MITVIPYVPENITVHLGAPGESAENVTLSFPNYIKNVASSEIYPTWNTDALYANIYAQISYALNRVYTEFYRSQGYSFDITSSTAYDQKFIKGRNYFNNISNIVDEIFNSYIRVQGKIEPLAAKYCNGTTVTCQGLSQWGSQYLAEDGYDYTGILKNYYGDDIEIVEDAPIQNIEESYPGYPISEGNRGPYVRVIQTILNRVSNDYPSIQKINPIDSIFGQNTKNAVIKFQQIFNLNDDGIVGRNTWYKMVYLYTGLKRLSELNSEGQTYYGYDLLYPDAITLGESGDKVRILQYMLSVFAQFDESIPPIVQDGIFGQKTLEAVRTFQKIYSLPVTGVVDEDTWDLMYRLLRGTYETVLFNSNGVNISVKPFPGYTLQIGSTGDDVSSVQQYINSIASVNMRVDPVSVTGVYGRATRSSVMQIQELYGLLRTGNVNEATWDAITNGYINSVSASNSSHTQYPGYVLKENDNDF